MENRKLYISPGTRLDIRFIDDEEAPLNCREWREQHNPKALQISVGHNRIDFYDPLCIIRYISCFGKLLGYANLGDLEKANKKITKLEREVKHLTECLNRG